MPLTKEAWVRRVERAATGIRREVQTTKSFRIVFYACILLAAGGLGVLITQSVFPTPACVVDKSPLPATMCFLGDSPRTPWGVVTSVLVHASFQWHFLPNMVVLFALAYFFARTNASLPGWERKSRQRLFVGGMVLSGIAANVVWLWVFRASANAISYGASGVVYGAMGVVLAFSLHNALSGGARVLGMDGERSNRSDLRFFVGNLVVFAVLGGPAFLSPTFFLSAGPGVNVLVHGLGFLFAFVSIGVMNLVLPLRERRPTSPDDVGESRDPRPADQGLSRDGAGRGR